MVRQVSLALQAQEHLAFFIMGLSCLPLGVGN